MNLSPLRKKIDRLDIKLFKIIKERLQVGKQIGLLKNENRMKILDKKREEEILKRIKNQAKEEGVNTAVVTEIWRILIRESKKLQK